MSKIGRKPITIPAGVDLKIDQLKVSVKGPKGELKGTLHDGVTAEIKDSMVMVKVKEVNNETMPLWGLDRAMIANLLVGVSQGFEKKMEINGVGYRATVQGKKINFELGFSHPIEMNIPEGLAASVKKNLLTLTGIDKRLLGQFAADIRALREPEPYKGKGIKYLEEHILRKEGKKAGAAEESK